MIFDTNTITWIIVIIIIIIVTEQYPDRAAGAGFRH